MRYLITLTFILSFTFTWSQKYSKVRVFADQQKIAELIQKGVTLDHGMRKPGVFIETDLSSSELLILEQEGVNYDVIISDVKSYYKNQNNITGQRANRSACGDNPWDIYTTPENFSLGTMAGFYTYQEYLDQIDSMASKYPNLITAKQPISTFQTHENRPIYHLRISDNPGVDEGEPQVLYSAIHHAREPGSLTQTIYYMWYLLENYGTDDEVTFLVDNTDMFFVPMINPDGYIINQTNDPNGGGMWRKNARDNNNNNVLDGNDGVDLNRNYDYQWGISGVSFDLDHDTYPGTGGFSEPETQAMQWLCENNTFEFAMNAHTYGDLLLYPLGYATNAVAPDAPYFEAYTSEMVKQNGYANIKSSDLYPAAGDSDDWMYEGDLATKPKIYALTPEIGYSFWPAANDIEEICKKNIYQNLVAAHLPHNHGTLKDLNPGNLTTTSGYLKYETQRLGLDAGGYTVSLTPLQGFSSNGSSNSYPAINLMDVEEDSISFTLDPNIDFGDAVQWIWVTDFGTWERKDTITKLYGEPQTQFNDNANDMSSWSNITNWDVTTQDFYSASSSITDSPIGNYGNSTVNRVELNQSFDLSNATDAVVKFYAKWEIETGWDFVQFEASTDGGNSWTPLCGEYTKTGNDNQDEGQPLYDGFQTSWVQESVKLSDYEGQNDVRFRFKLVSDNWVNEDGYYFDDFRVLYNNNGQANVENLTNHSLKVYPNPNNGVFNINLPEGLSNGSLIVRDITGRVVLERKVRQGNQTKLINIETVESGNYMIELSSQDNQFRAPIIIE